MVRVPACQAGWCGFDSRRQRVIPCFKCGYVAEPVDKKFPEQPYGATAFTSGGHYGSTVYDPMSQFRHLRIIICDKCLLDHRTEVQEVFVTPRASVHNYEPWDPGPFTEEEELLRDPEFIESLEQMSRGEGRVIYPKEFAKEEESDA